LKFVLLKDSFWSSVSVILTSGLVSFEPSNGTG